MRPRPAARAALLAPLAALALAVGVAPFGRALLDSFFHDLYGERSFAGLENYRSLLADRGLALSLGITAGWALAHVALTVALSLPVASRLARRRRRGGALLAAVLVPWAMPAYISAAIWRALVHGGWGSSLVSALCGTRVSLLTSPAWAVAATLTASVWISFPSTVFLLLAAVSGVPSALEEAARMDGATERQIDRWVRLPAGVPALAGAAALDLVRAAKEVTVILVMTGGGPPLRAGITENGIVGATTTLEVYLYGLFARTPDLGPAAAGALLVAALAASALWLVLHADRPRRQPRAAAALRGSPALWAAGSRLAAALVVASGAVLLGALLRLSFSGLSAVFFDTLLPRRATAEAYRIVLAEEGFARSLLNSLLLALPVAAAVPLLALPAAAALWGWGRERGASGVVAGVQLLGLVTGMHALVPLYALARALGLVGSRVPVVAIYTAHALPFALIALRGALRALPPSLADAARVEGMGAGRYLATVLAPLLAPTLAVCAAVGLLDAWNGFLAPLVLLTDDTRYPVSVKLFSLIGSVGSANPRWNLFAAGSVLNLLVVGALTPWRPMARGPLADGAE